jgi:hypothetical protein
MKTETVEEFLARGGKIQKSKSEVSLDQLLYNEGLLDKSDAEQVKKQLNEGLNSMLSSISSEKEEK